jgi:chromosome partitioning protein
MIIAVTNRKGGVGKSTMAAHLAAGLATQGFNVAEVDTDSQGHAALMLGMADENGLYKAMIEKVPFEEVVRLVPPEQYSTPDRPSKGNLYLLPSSDRTYQIPSKLEPDETFLFLQLMDDMKARYSLDVIVIDTNPTLSMFDGAVWLAVDGYLYVTECSRMSFDGVQEALTQFQRFGKQRERYLGRESHVIGILPNKFRANTRLHRHNIAQLVEAFGHDFVWPPVTLRTAWEEAVNAQELVYTYVPTGQEASDAWAVVDRTLEAVKPWQ